jgi:hypothetical protein
MRLAEAQSATQPPCQWQGGDDDGAAASGDFPTTACKFKFPKFNGSGDLLPCLNRCEHYFHVRWTPEHQRVAFTTFYLLDDAQLWFHGMELKGGQPIGNSLCS